MSIHSETESHDWRSDICPSGCGHTITNEYRKLLHDVLDEWLNQDEHSGGFYIGTEEWIKVMFK